MHSSQFPESGLARPTLQSLSEWVGGAASDLAEHSNLTDQFPWPMLIHVEGNIRYVNPACVALLKGKSAQDFINSSIAAVIHADYLGAALQRVRRILQGERKVEAVELLLLCRDGSTTWIETVGVPVIYQGQKAIQVIGRDIDDRKHAELAQVASENRFRSLARMGSDWYWEQDENLRFVEISNQELQRMLDVEPIGKQRWEMTDIRMDPAFWAQHRAALERREPFRDVEMRRLDRNGQWRVVTISGEPLYGTSGRFCGYRGIGRDITERKKVEESLLIANMVYQNTSESVIVTDAQNLIISVNPAFERTTGYQAQDVLGKDPSLLRSGRHDKAFFQAMWSAILETGQWRGEIWNRRRNGEQFLEQISINTSFNPDGSVHQRVALLSDITGEKQAAELIWRQANFDPLTNLSNRRMLQMRLTRAIGALPQDASRSVAVVLFDLDDFKQVNDSLGHAVGDNLLMEMASRLERCAEPGDTVARLGGDEFAVLMPSIEGEGQLTERLQQILHSLARPVTLGGQSLVCTASAGIALFPQDAATATELLAHADQAMYAAKKLGRQRFARFSPAMHEDAQSRVSLIRDLRQAVALGQLRLMFQPIVTLGSLQVHKAEALVRWEHPVRGWVNPAEFIPVAEEIGVISEIGDWVFQEAAVCVKHWRAKFDPSFQVSVNRSVMELKGEGLRVDWQARFRAMGLPGDSIVVELTESALIESDAPIRAWMQAHRKAGIQLAIDDFGTGYSSLSYLNRFEMDFLKIDQSFVRNLSPSSNDLVLSEVIILLAHKLGLKVIAEGVETELQRDLLKQAGCDFGQGYLWSKPLTRAEFEKLLTLDLMV